MFKVEKITSGDIELLPSVEDTTIWKSYNKKLETGCMNVVARLYQALYYRENYFQLNTPSAFGDTRYSYFCGVVDGILQSNNMEEIRKDDLIIIKRSGRKILVVDKLNRPQAYKDSIKENNDMISKI